ncbi:MAG: DNA mismatch repair protein MutS, partial [Methylococcales bacterium]|nr:DNA mismatch repair protein MutS [Methylococcales bacterium]
GAASQSYGLQVAALAGVPTPVIEKAREKLQLLEQQSYRDQQNSLGSDQLDLFNFEEHKPTHEAITLLETLEPEQLTPLEALQQLYALKKLL